MKPYEYKMGEATFYIHIFPPLTAMKILGEVQKALAPILGGITKEVTSKSDAQVDSLALIGSALGEALLRMPEHMDGERLQNLCKLLLQSDYIGVSTDGLKQPVKLTESVLDEVLISQSEENEEEARRILACLDLEQFADRHPQSLSGGQKQRVAVASAIASGRDIMLFDEPTSGLDYTHMLQIGEILRNLKAHGKTVIVVTHDRELIKECCDQEISLHDFNQI